MRYNLFLHYPEAGGDVEVSEEALAEGRKAFDDYAKAIDDAGALLGVNILQPSSASTTVTFKDGSLVVQDGPFIDTKEKLGGVFLIDVPDLDAAIAWAEKAPSAQWGTVEIRPTALTFIDGEWQSA
jgi:hypothetical protein